MRVVNRRPISGTRKERKMKVLIAERINSRYQRMTGRKQNCGLSVCTGMIAQSLESVVVVGCNDINDLANYIKNNNPQVVILEALWMKAEHLIGIKMQNPKTKFYVHIHSNLGFLSIESYALNMIYGHMRQGNGIIFNSIHAYNAFKHFKNIYYLPNIYDKPYLPLKIQERDELHIGCFGSIRPMKNHIMQASAAILYANSVNKKLNFYVNFNRTEDNGEAVKKNIAVLFEMNNKHQLINQPWMEQKDFINSLQKMDVCLQVSMNESFNITAADAVAAGCPVVVSNEIEWVSELCYAKHSNPEEIANKIDFVMKSPLLVNINRGNLNSFNEFAKNKWKQFIDSHE